MPIQYEKELNPQQLAAVRAPPGPLLIIAGAGSGKTRTLTYRVAFLIEQGLPPERLLLLTFTNKAAKEMLKRVEGLLPVDSNRVAGGTFHSICNRLLRRNAKEAGFEPGFSILDEEDAKEVVGQAVVEAGIDSKKSRFPKPEVLKDIFSLSINTERSVASIIQDQYEYFEEISSQIQDVQQRYQQRKKAINAMDYDDLLYYFLQMMRTNEEVREKYQRIFQYVLVDEYQDTNKIQSDIVDLLAARHRNIMVVGDDAQSIYSWRGANFRNIMEFPKRFAGATVIRIEQNYRSTPQVLELANASISHNTEQFEKNLQPVRQQGPKPVVAAVSNPYQQAEFVANQVLELRDQGVELSEMCVLYRAHYHTMELQMELTRRNIPFHVTSGIRFFEQAHIKDVAAHLKLVRNPNDELSFKRLARLLPKVGAATADKIWGKLRAGVQAGGIPALIAQMNSGKLGVPKPAEVHWKKFSSLLERIASPEFEKHPGEMIQQVAESWYTEHLKASYPNYLNRLEDIQQLSTYAGRFTDVDTFLSELALMTNMEVEQVQAGRNEDSSEVLRLSTVHQAKGLEFKIVFVIWLADGMFPSARSLQTRANEEEERRLFYVAVTRAKDQLFLIYPMIRTNAGYQGDIFQKPSRFLKELPKRCIEQAELPETSSWAWSGSTESL